MDTLPHRSTGKDTWHLPSITRFADMDDTVRVSVCTWVAPSSFDNMKICVLAYPRVASTLLVYTIGNHLRDHHGLQGRQILNECFVPSDKRWLIETDDHLEHVNLAEPVAVPQMREVRVDLMQKYKHQDYVIKLMSFDTLWASVLSFAADAGYEIFAIERHDPYAALLSALVASEYDYWNQGKHQPDDSRPDYHEFEADMNVAKFMGRSIRQYYNVKRWMPIKETFYFEDVIAMKPFEILQKAGFDAVDDGAPHVTKKLLGANNAALIKNIDEVKSYYETEVVPHLNIQS
jgi:hypothetical protein